MKIIASPSEMRRVALRPRRSGETIALVPTMGFLHAGHLSLMRLGRQKADMLVVSIFVNPIQFGPNEDFDRYPRNLDRDMRLCEGEGVDVCFCPNVAEMYPRDHSVFVEETALSHVGLCDASRPGHFRGVTTVVAKLFNIVQPDIAVFGQKDAQQIGVIRKMVEDLNFPIEIHVGPTIREPDGLAMSSRNVNLSPGDRKRALGLFHSLQLAERLHREGIRDAERIEKAMRESIALESAADIDYVRIVDPRTLSPLTRIEGTALVAVAARIGGTRLIDNLVMSSGDGPSPGAAP